jgi:hypothetical protein
MCAFYDIRTGCGDLLDTVEIELPDGITDSEVEAYVLRKSGYADWVSSFCLYDCVKFECATARPATSPATSAP